MKVNEPSSSSRWAVSRAYEYPAASCNQVRKERGITGDFGCDSEYREDATTDEPADAHSDNLSETKLSRHNRCESSITASKHLFARPVNALEDGESRGGRWVKRRLPFTTCSGRYSEQQRR